MFFCLKKTICLAKRCAFYGQDTGFNNYVKPVSRQKNNNACMAQPLGRKASMNSQKDLNAKRRGFIKASLLGTAALASAAGGLFSSFGSQSTGLGISPAKAEGTRYKMAFIQWQPHTVPAAWS